MLFATKNEFDNFLYKTSKGNIWTPTVEFSDVKEETSLSGLSRNENDEESLSYSPTFKEKKSFLAGEIL